MGDVSDRDQRRVEPSVRTSQTAVPVPTSPADVPIARGYTVHPDELPDVVQTAELYRHGFDISGVRDGCIAGGGTARGYARGQRDTHAARSRDRYPTVVYPQLISESHRMLSTLPVTQHFALFLFMSLSSVYAETLVDRINACNHRSEWSLESPRASGR